MITVNVSGRNGSGKSTVSYIIANALLAAGFKTSVKFLDGESMKHVSEDIGEKMASVREKETISIVETNLCRDGSFRLDK